MTFISASVEFSIQLDPEDRFDLKLADDLTIEVELVEIELKRLDQDPDVWVWGHRRLRNGRLSVQDPQAYRFDLVTYPPEVQASFNKFKDLVRDVLTCT